MAFSKLSRAKTGSTLSCSCRLLIATEKSVSMFGKDFEICFYNEELEAMVNRERDIVRTLSAKAANEDTDNALFLQYQPIMNTRTDTLFGFEALARLKTETLGLVSPLNLSPSPRRRSSSFPSAKR